jgi:triacylglycerol esterase/lipase EstA (alpha/beta hydrolase family)
VSTRTAIVVGVWLPVVAMLALGCGGKVVEGAQHDAGSESLPADDAGAGPDDAPAPLDAGCDPAASQELDKGVLERGAALTDVALAGCTSHRYSVAAAAGAEMTLEIRSLQPRRLGVSVTYPDGSDEIVSEGTVPADGTVISLTFLAPRSGEFFVRIRHADLEVEDKYHLSFSCFSKCDLETTLFPIVLVHGWTGWSSVGSYEYFYQVPETLTDAGFPVAVASLDPYNSVEVRSGQLATQVDQFLAEARARKVDFIAHSQGGLDARRLISTLGYGDRVSALVTVATPHQGTPVCDMALGYLPGPGMDVLAWLLNLLGAAGGNQSDAEASFNSLSQRYVQAEFNPANPNDPRVSYVSWTGKTCLLGEDCGDECDVEIVAAYLILKDAAGDNDGMVPVSSAPWGDYRGTVPADHFDEIGQLAGVTNANFDHKEFYLRLAGDLAAEGH